MALLPPRLRLLHRCQAEAQLIDAFSRFFLPLLKAHDGLSLRPSPLQRLPGDGRRHGSPDVRALHLIRQGL